VRSEKYDAFFSPSLPFLVKNKPTFFSETIDFLSESAISFRFFLCIAPLNAYFKFRLFLKKPKDFKKNKLPPITSFVIKPNSSVKNMKKVILKRILRISKKIRGEKFWGCQFSYFCPLVTFCL
jgi:hypothetical protein